MNYSDKLKSPLWQKKRLEILKANKWKCKLCKDEETTLHVHHNYYKNGCEPWDYPNLYFTVLCEHCHYEVERLKKIEEISDIKEILIYKSINCDNASRVMFIKNWALRKTKMRIYNKNSEFIQEYNFSVESDLNNISKFFKH